MKITYECEFCGFHSQNKEEVEKCEAQGVKSKFSVDEEVEYALDNEKKQWGKVVVSAILFKERTHEIHCYVIKPKNEIVATFPEIQKALVVDSRQVNEEELRPSKQEQIDNQKIRRETMSEEKFLSPQECEFPDDVPKVGQVVQIQLPATECLNPMVLETTVKARNVGTRCWVIHVYEPISKEMISFQRDLDGEWHEELQKGGRKAKIL